MTDDDCEGGTDPTFGSSVTIGPDPLNVTGFTTFSQNVQVNALLQANTVAANLAGISTANIVAALNVQNGATVDMGNNRVQNVATPTAGTDAANKQYVDDQNATQNTRITAVENVNATQQTQINSNTARITTVEAVNASQQTQIDNITSVNDGQQVQINANTQDILALQSDVENLQERDDELEEGIAISLALDAPHLRTGQTFAMRGGWGNFEGANAVGFTAAGAITSNVVLDAGVGFGTNEGTVAGKGGVTVGW